MAEKSSPRTRQTDGTKLGLFWKNRKKISQIINAFQKRVLDQQKWF
jgi:hypothetical protein